MQDLLHTSRQNSCDSLITSHVLVWKRENSTNFIKHIECLTLQNPLGKEGFDIRINTPIPGTCLWREKLTSEINHHHHLTSWDFRLETKKVPVFFSALLCSLIGYIRHFGWICFSSSGFSNNLKTSTRLRGVRS
jgi:hypothetical protein